MRASDFAEPEVEREPGLSADDRRRANRISVLAHRLAGLENLLSQASGRGIHVALPASSGQPSVVPPVTLRPPEAETLLTAMILDTKQELNSLL